MQMTEVAKRFADTLQGALVDDNRQPLSDSQLDHIRREFIGKPQATMASFGLPPVRRKPCACSPDGGSGFAAERLAARRNGAHNHAYYVLDAPSIPDAEYDKLFRELQAWKAYPELLAPIRRHSGWRRAAQGVSAARSMACRCCR
jgi:hypothetical protein